MDKEQKLTKTIQDLRTALSKAEKELEDVKKPELRHGDYGIDTEQAFVVVIKANHAPGLKRPLEFKYGDGSRCPIDNREINWHGNFVDEMNRNSNDLTEFEVPNFDEDRTLSCVIAEEGRCLFSIAFNGTKGASLTYENAVKFHQKLGQLLATANRKRK